MYVADWYSMEYTVLVGTLIIPYAKYNVHNIMQCYDNVIITVEQSRDDYYSPLFPERCLSNKELYVLVIWTMACVTGILLGTKVCG